MEKILLNRDIWREQRFYTDHARTVSAVNDWIIPLFVHLGIAITFENIEEYLGSNDTKGYFLDIILRKKANGTIWPSRLRQLQLEAEKEFDKILTDIIQQGERMKAQEADYKRSVKEYQDKINELEEKLPTARAGDIPGINEQISIKGNSLARLEAFNVERRKVLVEDEKRDFEEVSKERFKLSEIRDLVKLNGKALEFDEKKVAEKFSVYAENKKEVKLFDKLKELNSLLNEIYGTPFDATSALAIFFTADKNGRAAIRTDIRKETIIRYAQNL